MLQTSTRMDRVISTNPANSLNLAPNFTPDVDLILSEGVAVFGVKGAGKSNVCALLSEQISKFYVPMVILDTENEYQSLASQLPRAFLADSSRCPTGSEVMERGLQVILNLRSWDAEEAAALAICQLIHELFDWSTFQPPAERVPCLVFLDEAAYWLPQQPVSYLSKSTQKDLRDSFRMLATRGRKLGLAPMVFTQRISALHKDVLAQSGVYILMRQVLDVDLDRYLEFVRSNQTALRTKMLIRAFPKGKAVVCMPDGMQLTVTFNKRQSEHTSNTPRAAAAMKRYAALAAPDGETPLAPAAPVLTVQPVQKQQRRSAPKKQATVPTVKERIAALHASEPDLSKAEIARRIGCDASTVSRWFSEQDGKPRR